MEGEVLFISFLVLSMWGHKWGRAEVSHHIKEKYSARPTCAPQGEN